LKEHSLRTHYRCDQYVTLSPTKNSNNNNNMATAKRQKTKTATRKRKTDEKKRTGKKSMHDA